MNQTPCGRCAANLGNLDIPCWRGDVFDLLAEVPFLCPSRVGADRLPRDIQELPQDLRPGASLLSKTRRRQRHDRSKVDGGEMRGSESAIFPSVAKTEAPPINKHNLYRELNVSIEIPHDDLIISIVWELEDNPDAARLMGITSIKHFVAFLEAASVCESQFGPHNYKKRLCFTAMHLLLYSFAGLRLSRSDLLAGSAHAYCQAANECISPALHSLTKYSARYAETLTKALFHKKRDGPHEWLLIFYSLCLQAHVRLALMTIEARLYSMDPTADGLAGSGYQPPLVTANYLRTASIIFEQISLQKNGKLAKKICNDLARVEPSVYLKKANLNESDIKWKNWQGQEDMILKHLRMIFDVGLPINSSAATMHHHPHEIRPLALGPDIRYTKSDSGSDITMRAPTPTGTITPNAMGQPFGAVEYSLDRAPTPTSTIMLNAMDQPSGVVENSLECGDDRSMIGSIHSATTGGASFDTWTMDARSVDNMSVDNMSIAESVASNGTIVPDPNFHNFVLNHQGGVMFNNNFPIDGSASEDTHLASSPAWDLGHQQQRHHPS